jgi:hypothetical protein
MAINKPVKKTQRTISTANIFTDSAELKGYFNCSVSGTFVGTVTIQRSFDSGDTWYDVKTFTSIAEEFGFEPEAGVVYRAGIKEGGYASGEAIVRLSQ